jgi:hypothetical protein
MFPEAGVRVYLATGVTDMRKSISGLSILVGNHLAMDPFSGHLFARGGRGCLDRRQVFISGTLPLVHDHAAACFCDCAPK